MSVSPLDRLLIVMGYTVTVVWAVMFILAPFIPPRDSAVYLSVQSVMMVVAGGLITDRAIRKRRRNGSNGGNGNV